VIGVAVNAISCCLGGGDINIVFVMVCGVMEPDCADPGWLYFMVIASGVVPWSGWLVLQENCLVVDPVMGCGSNWGNCLEVVPITGCG